MTRRLVKESKPINTWLGTRLHLVRRRLGLTQQAVGAIMQRTDSTISDLENGYTDITADHLSRFATGLELPMAGLLLPDPGATATEPFRHRAKDSSLVVDLVVDPRKRALLARLLEALPGLSEAQLHALVSRLPRATPPRGAPTDGF